MNGNERRAKGGQVEFSLNIPMTYFILFLFIVDIAVTSLRFANEPYLSVDSDLLPSVFV